MTSTVQMMLQFNGKQLTLPINPEKLTISRSAENADLNIIGLGKVARKGEPSLKTLSIESFFPSASSYFFTGVSPSTCIEFINEIWKTENTNNNVAKLVITGIPIPINMYIVIDSFNYDHRAGEEDDIYYTLGLKEYVAYGVKTVKVDLSGLASARAQAAQAVQSSAVRTYVVKKGDCLWNIAKAFSGNGANWPSLYNLNKGVIGGNPNLIYPGQVLTLPEGWSSNGAVAKLSNVSSNKTNSKLGNAITNTIKSAGNTVTKWVNAVANANKPYVKYDFWKK